MELSTPTRRTGGRFAEYNPIHVLTISGFKSIVNNALLHPTLPLMATSGIESYIRLHRALPSDEFNYEDNEKGWVTGYSPTRMIPTSVPARDRLRALRYMLTGDDSEGGLAEDERSMLLFDEIIREEQDTDIFAVRLVNDPEELVESDETEDSANGDPDNLSYPSRRLLRVSRSDGSNEGVSSGSEGAIEIDPYEI